MLYIEAIKEIHTGYFFAPDTMRFFQSRVSSYAYTGGGGAYFVTSERPPTGKRVYAVRCCDLATGNISTVESDLKSHGVADRVAQRYAASATIKRSLIPVFRDSAGRLHCYARGKYFTIYDSGLVMERYTAPNPYVEFNFFSLPRATRKSIIGAIKNA